MNSVVLITGAASGIGLSISDLLLSCGYSAITELSKKYSELHIHFAVGNVSDENDGRQAINECINYFGKLDILVNNAGTGTLQFTYDLSNDKVHDLESFRRIIEINTVGTFNMSRLAAQAMSKNEPDEDQQRGLIINISSTSAFESTAGHLAYSSSKAAINGMTLSMAKDLASIGIRVTTICPGATETPALKQFISIYKDYKVPTLFPELCCSAKEIGQAIKFIIECKVVNGACWRVDGGGRV
ncbi:hypothetical protein GJ496_009561 [Pomphorhynchus laevis]|nr:hypothetical protein GJ496_009561 [Pomphorhynchus laevis]